MNKKIVVILGALLVVMALIIIVFVFSSRSHIDGVHQHKKIHAQQQNTTRPTFYLKVKDHHFVPQELTIPEETRFFINIENQDDRVDEFESYDMKFERIVPPHQTRIVHGGPLHLKRNYEFFDDFHPSETRGRVIVQPRSS